MLLKLGTGSSSYLKIHMQLTYPMPVKVKHTLSILMSPVEAIFDHGHVFNKSNGEIRYQDEFVWWWRQVYCVRVRRNIRIILERLI